MIVGVLTLTTRHLVPWCPIFLCLYEHALGHSLVLHIRMQCKTTVIIIIMMLSMTATADYDMSCQWTESVV